MDNNIIMDMTKELENLNLEELIQEMKMIGTLEDRMERSKEVEAVKSAFYKQLGKLKADAEAAGEDVAAKFEETEERLKSVYADYKRERQEYNKKLESERQANLEKKKAIIEDLKKLVDNLNDVQSSFPALRDIQARWKETGPVPASEYRDINNGYTFLVETFYDKVQINHDLRDLDFKKNLEAKEKLCEQAEELAASEDVVGAFVALQNLHEQWKDWGPVAKEYRESIWERFKLATSVVNKRHQDHFEKIKANFASNLEAKTALCEEVEAIAGKEDIKDSSEWNNLSKQIEQIQLRWKKIGFAARKDNQRIYDRFRAACDKFYERKRVFFAALKDEMEENVARKEAIIARAEELKSSTDWKRTADQFISLQAQWKEIGSVPRKKSEQLWKRFRAACDEFFAARDANAKPENDFYGNLKAKRALIAEIKAYVPVEGVTTEQAEAEFSNRYKAIGFVPFKDKDSIAKEYKDAMRAAFPPVQTRSDLIRRYNALQQDITTYENNIGFFANSSNSEPLINRMREKINQAKAELKEIEEEIRSQKQS